jgi:hypothetical protein
MTTPPGHELTFNYNAATDSLQEYRSAVCLCGYDNCRGSFLHFATPDCYQEVLSRNSPIDLRFANLFKGSTKPVMSEEDERILNNHGFRTASGAPRSMVAPCLIPSALSPCGSKPMSQTSFGTLSMKEGHCPFLSAVISRKKRRWRVSRWGWV